MSLIFSPIHPWFELALGTFPLLLTAVIWRSWQDRKRNHPILFLLGQRKSIRALVLGLTLLGLSLLIIASANPILSSNRQPKPFHIELVLDVSDSVTRSASSLEDFGQRAARLLELHLGTLPPALLANGTGGITTLRGQASTARGDLELDQLPAALAHLEADTLAGGTGTNLANGLRKGASRIQHQGGRGALILMTDGNQTEGNAIEEARAIAARGFAIHILPLEGSLPELAIEAADLPHQVHSETQTFVRGRLHNNSSESMDVQLTLARNSNQAASENQAGQELRADEAFSLPPLTTAPFRWPITFKGKGIQYIDLTLTRTGGLIHKRRFFTQVRRPPKILSIGGDHRWVAAFSPESAEIREISPQQLGIEAPIRDYDVVVISGIPASSFDFGVLDDLAAAIREDGLGLFLFNGPHSGAGEQDQTVLMSYNDTAIEPLLPVESRPKPKEWEPPSRQVVLLIDTSGSMEGPRMEMARDIATHIIGNLLRPKDYLDLITFAGEARHLLSKTLMNAEGKDRALNLLQQLAAGGGTDPANALELIGNRRMEQCGLIFISDGEFEHLDYRPDCRATVFAIGRYQVSADSPLRALADPFPVPDGFNPANISIPYFEPQKRKVFFESGTYNPLSLNQILPLSQQMPMPELALSGSAVCSIVPEAIQNAVRPRIASPVLAFRSAGLGRTGVLTTGPGDQWLARTQGKQAIRTWIDSLSPLQAENRYDFRIRESGSNINIQVSLRSEDGRPPAVDQLFGRISIAAETDLDLRFQPVQENPATFQANLTLNRSQARAALLTLEESGSEALLRPQRIPFLIPASSGLFRGDVREGLTYGINEPLLRQIAEITGGIYAPQPGQALFNQSQNPIDNQNRWAFLVIPGLMCYLAAIALQRWDP